MVRSKLAFNASILRASLYLSTPAFLCDLTQGTISLVILSDGINLSPSIISVSQASLKSANTLSL
ncbi:MAG: hypothetical protein GY932_07765 [Arcobacter sp.]|nr:hypothetical protein [Arcobacter sp.]